MADIDPRSDRVALYYTGSEEGRPAISGVPARDLTENDVARAVRVQHGPISGAAHASAVDSLFERLTAGPYRRTPPTAPTTAKAEPKKPADPGTTPEG